MHWADDQVLVELQRHSEDGMSRARLMSAVGIGSMDFDECLEALRADGLVRQEGFQLFWAGEDPPGSEPVIEEKPAEKPEVPVVTEERKREPVTLGADAAVLSLLEQARKGEPIIMRAIVELRSNENGELELEAVERVLEVRLED